MSDNGGRRTIPGEKSQDLNLPLRNGKGTMYEGGIRVPFMICGPGIEKNTCSSVPVSGVDLLPTMADLAGGTMQHERLDGGSLKNLVKGKAAGVQRNQNFLVFHHAVKRRPQSAIRQGDYKLVKTYREDKVELFDLSKDFAEKNDLADQMPGKRKELEAALERYLQQARATVEYIP
jgi:arylsulfatase A-like enzyme